MFFKNQCKNIDSVELIVLGPYDKHIRSSTIRRSTTTSKVNNDNRIIFDEKVHACYCTVDSTILAFTFGRSIFDVDAERKPPNISRFPP